MADQLDDAQDASANKSKPDYQAQMAAVKEKFGNGDSAIDSSKSDDDASNDDSAATGAEGDDSQTGDNSNNGGDTNNQGGGSGNEDDNGDGAGSGDEGKSFEGRFSQFKGDGTSEAYVKNLEDGYQNSSQEAIRLKDERDSFERQVNAIKQAAAQDKEFGARLVDLLNGNGNGDSGDSKGSGNADDLSNKASGNSDNPFLKDAETNWNKESEAEAAKFAEANPEVLTDPKINEDVKRYMRIFSNDIYEREGRLIKAGEAMKMAYRTLGLEDKSETQGDLTNGLKQHAAPTRPQAPKKKSSGSGGNDSKQFSNLTLSIAQKMGMTKERLEKGSKR